LKKNIFIGGAWPYANYSLHIGHLAALLPGDIIARYYRGKGDNVIYVSGTDSHGTPITVNAQKTGVTPKEIATHYHDEFTKTFESLNFSYDLYTSTMSPYHQKQVQDYFKKMLDNGFLYEKTEQQDFCDNCGKFLSDREIVGICPQCKGKSTGEQCEECFAALNAEDVLDKHCKTCNTPTTLKNNKHLYFKLSAFQKELEKLINDTEGLWRKEATGEARKFLSLGLIDRAATRQLDWGVDVPVKGFKDKKIYVWFEAVLGYLTTGRAVSEQKGIDFDEYMKTPQTLTYYVHGKDNIPFHAIIFPALIKAIGLDYQLPKYIISSGYVNTNDEKMSKSKGNLVTINELVKKYNVDTLRYYLIANGPEKKDVNFSDNDLILNHNKYLVGTLGNFIHRNLSFIFKKFNGLIVETEIDKNIIKETKMMYKEVGSLIEKGELKSAISLVMDYISLGNKYYDTKQPWKLATENLEEFNKCVYTCVYMVANIANLIYPFIPATSEKIKQILNLSEFKWEEETIKGDIKIDEPKILFERILVKE